MCAIPLWPGSQRFPTASGVPTSQRCHSSATGAHRATVQRNIDWMEEKGLVREVTGQGRYRMWRIVETRATEGKAIHDRHDGVLAEDLFDVLAARQ